MNLTRTCLLLSLLFSASVAEARPRHRPPPRHVVGGPRVHVVINPWAPSYVPAARAGWLWVPGVYVGPRWRPGYWAPAAPRIGWLWVPGYWSGTVYVDGYWRDHSRQGQVWVDGYYDEEGTWVPGYWAPADSVDAAREEAPAPPPADSAPADGAAAPVFHEYE